MYSVPAIAAVASPTLQTILTTEMSGEVGYQLPSSLSVIINALLHRIAPCCGFYSW